MKAWWLPPLLAGALVAGGAWALDAALDAAPASAPPEGVAYTFPFLHGPAIPCDAAGACDWDATVLAIAHGRTTAQDVRDATWPPGAASGPQPVLPSEGEVERIGQAVGRLRLREEPCPRADDRYLFAHCGSAGPDVAVLSRPANRTSVTLTFYAFRDDGRLQATNAGPAEAARFEAAGDQVRVEARAFALAPGAPGAPLPGFVEQVLPDLRERLRTLPAGGILTRSVEQHALQDVLGTLHVTLRVEP